MRLGQAETLSATTPDANLTRMDWVLTPLYGGAEIVIGTDATSPYSQPWVPAQAAGTYYLVARAVLNANEVDSEPIFVTIIDTTDLQILIDSATDSVNDRSLLTNVATVQGSAGTFADDFNENPALAMATGQGITYTGDVVDNHIGSDLPYTIVAIVLPTTVGGAVQNIAGWARETGGGADKGAHLRCSNTARNWQSLLRDDGGLATTIQDTGNTWFHRPQMMIFRQTGIAGSFDMCGVNDAPQAQDRGLLTPENFSVWCFLAASGLNATGNGQLQMLAVYSIDIPQAIRDIWIGHATALGIPVAGAPAVDELTGIFWGQSNGEGPFGTITPTVGVVGYDLDSFVKMAPTSLNNGDTPATFPTLYPVPGPRQALALFVGRHLVNDYGVARAGLISTCRGGSTASEWVFDTSNPPLTLCAASLLWIGFFSTINGVFVAGKRYMVVYQGEADSAVEADALAWSTKWTAIIDSVQAFFGELFPVIFVNLSATNPDPTNFPFWQTTRAGIASMAQPAKNWYVVQAPNAPNPPDVHLAEPQLDDLGSTIATLLNTLFP